MKSDIEGFKTLFKHPEVLQKCQSLKTLQTFSLGPDSFKWAVRERVIMNGLGGASNIRNQEEGGKEGVLTLGTLSDGLVPLEDVTIEMHQEPSLTDIDDIVFAFKKRGELQSPSSYNYLSHVRHLLLQRRFQGIHHVIGQSSPEKSAFLESDEFEGMCRSNPLPEQYRDMIRDAGKCPRRFQHGVILLLETFWTLQKPILERLQSLTISLTLFRQYHDLVGRLRSLETADFLMDRLYEHVELNDAESMARMAEDTQGILLFVQDHTQLFPGVLKTVTYGNFDIWPTSYMFRAYASVIAKEVLQLLPPARITEMSCRTWHLYTAHPLATDFSGIRVISNLYPLHPWLTAIHGDPRILQRCRSLKTLDLISAGQGSFRWAVEEKSNAEGLASTSSRSYYSCSRIRRYHAGGQDAGSQPSYWRDGLIPLESVKISEGRMRLSDEIDDIAIAFSRTLTRVEAETIHYHSFLPDRYFVGRGWVNLPHLRELKLTSHGGPFVIDCQLLAHCPNLIDLRIADTTTDYCYKDVIPCQPARLARLVSLHLTGWSALTFHPATLHSTTKLTMLSLMMFTSNPGELRTEYFIPPVEKMEQFGNLQDKFDKGAEAEAEIGGGGSVEGVVVEELPTLRPRWSWDWDLPQLTQLELSGEFAYQFKFQMFQRCPQLNHVTLDITTADGEHRRILSEADMFPTPRLDDGSDDGCPSSTCLREQDQERIVAPSMKTLLLLGPWIISDSFLQEFIPSMFPNLWCLGELQSEQNGVSVGGLLKLARSMPTLNLVSLRSFGYPFSSPSPEQVTEFGLYQAAENWSRPVESTRNVVDVMFMYDSDQTTYKPTVAATAAAIIDAAPVETAAADVIAKPGQLMADASPEPTMTMDDFFAKAKTDGMPLEMPEATLQART
ncbi:hypothetical protein BGW39_004769 [Mortierella sp. 14UC]|nr:hypothetical protein BGW39_004769 [Mortierella sp. 14UC]